MQGPGYAPVFIVTGPGTLQYAVRQVHRLSIKENTLLIEIAPCGDFSRLDLFKGWFISYRRAVIPGKNVIYLCGTSASLLRQKQRSVSDHGFNMIWFNSNCGRAPLSS